MFALEMDSKTAETLARLSLAGDIWSASMDSLATELAQVAEEHFKPMLSVRPNHTGQTEASIRHEIRFSGDGFDITYYGLESANWMDEGNFPASTVISAADYGYKAFPIDQRFGEPMFRSTIHGMGSRNPDAPTHWAEKTVDWLADGEALDIALKHAMDFLTRAVV